jgi:hypothetical protein
VHRARLLLRKRLAEYMGAPSMQLGTEHETDRSDRSNRNDGRGSLEVALREARGSRTSH